MTNNDELQKDRCCNRLFLDHIASILGIKNTLNSLFHQHTRNVLNYVCISINFNNIRIPLVLRSVLFVPFLIQYKIIIMQ